MKNNIGRNKVEKKGEHSKTVKHKRNYSKAHLKLSTSPDIQSVAETWELLTNLNDRVLPELVDEKNWHTCLKTLHKIQALIQQSKGIVSKSQYYSNLSFFYNNKSFVLNELGYFEEAIQMMGRCISNVQLTQQYIRNKEELVAWNIVEVKTAVKYCALFSHSGQHFQAISLAQGCLTKINQVITTLLSLCKQLSNSFSSTPETLASDSESRLQIEKVNFRSIVMREALKLLRKTQLFPSLSELFGKHRAHFEQKIQNVYSWKSNAENNFENVRKELFQRGSVNSQRNLLGVKKVSTFLDDFSLSESMQIEVLKLGSKSNYDLYYLLSEHKIIQLFLLASVCYFIIATEMRCSQGSKDLSKMKIAQKYQKLGYDPELSSCKILHFKAIQIAGEYLPQDSQYLIHLIKSFNKNYKSVLDLIKEEPEISRISHLQQNSRTINSHQSTTDQVNNSKPKKKNCLEKKRSISSRHSTDILGAFGKRKRCLSNTKLRSE